MNSRALLAAVLLVILAPVSQAQEAAEEAPVYQVEVIIFRHADQSRTTTEIPRVVEPEIADLLDQQLPRLVAGDFSDSAARGQADSENTGSEWRPVRTGLQMAADARRIDRLDAYELISHLAWQQPAADIAVALPIAANDLGAPLPVTGEFKLYRKRYLHLSVDLTLNDGGMQSLLSDSVGSSIVDSRRMRFGRTAYFDQPQFGVIAVINKVEQSVAGNPAG